MKRKFLELSFRSALTIISLAALWCCTVAMASAEEQSSWLKKLEAELVPEIELAFMKQVLEPKSGGKGKTLEQEYQAIGRWLSDGGTANEPQDFRIISSTFVFFGTQGAVGDFPSRNTHIEDFKNEDYKSCITWLRLPQTKDFPSLTMVSLIEVRDSHGTHVYLSKKRFHYKQKRWSCTQASVKKISDAE